MMVLPFQAGRYMDYLNSILIEAEKVFGDKERAAAWLSMPRAAFGDRSALELSSDHEGYKKVLEELMRLEHGFAS